MSAALVRQALEFLDPDVTAGKSSKSKKRGGDRPQRVSGQDSLELHKNKKSKNKNINKETITKKDNQVSKEVIAKLLRLSEPTLTDKKIANKIFKRATTGKPVGDKIKVKKDVQKSILFPEENFKEFERKPFCS